MNTIDQARRNLAEAKERERERIAKLVEESNADVMKAAAARRAEETRQAEQQEAERAAQRAAEAAAKREAKLRRYLSYGGKPEQFDEWYAGEVQRELTEQMERDQAAAAYLTRKNF